MGKQIRIYLADGSSSGIRHAEIANWTGQALACPRSRFQELRDWEEVKRPGVYFLFGSSEETGEEAVYIGEAEVVLDRLYSHMSGKDFWTELIAFTSKDDNLTKGHVRYLESRLIESATAANRYKVTNASSPSLPALPRADKDAMEEYLISTGILLGVLGHRVLEPLVATARTTKIEVVDQHDPDVAHLTRLETDVALSTPVNLTFHLHISDLRACATRTDEGLVVLADSEASESAQTSLSGGYRMLRDKLIQSGVLVSSGNKLKFTRDHLFSSPSQAAAILVGYSINGRDAWRLPDGTTYATYEARITATLLNELSGS